MKNKGPYVYKEDMELKLLEAEYEVAFLRNHISELNIQLLEYKQTTLRSMIVATRFRDMFEGFFNRVGPKVEAMLNPPKVVPKKPAPKKRQKRR